MSTRGFTYLHNLSTITSLYEFSTTVTYTPAKLEIRPRISESQSREYTINLARAVRLTKRSCHGPSLGAKCHRERKMCSLTGARTRDPSLTGRMLYRLSYPAAYTLLFPIVVKSVPWHTPLRTGNSSSNFRISVQEIYINKLTSAIRRTKRCCHSSSSGAKCHNERKMCSLTMARTRDPSLTEQMSTDWATRPLTHFSSL